jgi:hypothetical protein
MKARGRRTHGVPSPAGVVAGSASGERGRYRRQMVLVDELRRIARAAGSPLEQLNAGRDRYGAVDAILLGPAGFISVHVNPDGGYDVAVWDDELTAWGHTSSAYDIVETMRRWQNGLSAGNLSDNGGYLTTADETNAAAAVEAQWQLLLRYRDEYLSDIAVAAATNSTLRRLRPWVSHGTLYLLHRTDRVESTRRSLAFHPGGDGTYQVNVYDGPLSPRLSSAGAATFAAGAADNW